jgi:hypothetical protein
MLLSILAERHAGAHVKVMQSLRNAEKIAQALPVEWLPVEIDVEVVDSIDRQLTPATMAALISERQRQEMGSALFKTFVATATKLFGLSPATIIRHLNRGWQQLLSDCGEIDVVKLEKRSATLMLRGLPDVCLGSRAWIGALAPGMRVLFELVNASGDVVASTRGHDVELRFDW